MYSFFNSAPASPLTMDGGGDGVAPEQQHQDHQEPEKVNFIVGGEDGQDEDEDEDQFTEDEAGDLFPTEANPPTRENSSSSNLNNMFALAEKRKRLRAADSSNRRANALRSIGSGMNYMRERYQQRALQVLM
ncbi:hypothetical protein C0J52_06032 [Blattella germanica]|nr:hypothetical protein C0J52_06032 [Blattella germanica]